MGEISHNGYRKPYVLECDTVYQNFWNTKYCFLETCLQS